MKDREDSAKTETFNKPVYLWLLSAFPIIHLYALNIGTVTDVPALYAIIASLFATTVLFFLFRWLTNSSQRSAIITAAMLLLFFSYGHLEIFLDEKGLKWGELPFYGMLTLTLLFSLLAWFLPASNKLKPLVNVCNIAAVVMLISPTFTIAKHWVFAMSSDSDQQEEQNVRPVRASKVRDSEENPDIYYVIMDAYSSNRQFKRDLGYDNSSFTKSLEKMGFVVGHEAKSNYRGTLYSLASTLNLRYITEELKGEKGDNMNYLRKLIADSFVAQFLIQRGYTYTFMLSGYLSASNIADENLDFTPGGISKTSGNYFREPFFRFFIKTTLLRRLNRNIDPWTQGGHFPYEWNSPQRFLDTLEKLKTVPDNPDATFSFVHLLEPHSPVQFDRNGDTYEPTNTPTLGQFVDELEFVNERMLETFQEIIDKSTTPPIIILQADHGNRYKLKSDQIKQTDPLNQTLTLEGKTTPFGIMDAFHIPANKKVELPSDVSPINSFGILLRDYFDREYEIQEVKHFHIFDTYEPASRMVDVTEEVRKQQH